ncbi:ribonuclease H-like domain-containing protein [Thamnocephalis sphaerospora]|uniref:Ribonuclease H-like domain-containing protein n=1 Tax=Thamnocephalis sphaerospora TaxID=78915 RepID=A0A4P9XGH2_9FUNG|nr:ribonuclease H-like domain-containing protein [Thamnocephalis sphaerospora]|eukprot:RKP04712.1 ribonuclease H-like domain-containing protein [Thamnocephalis sphaerospora]
MQHIDDSIVKASVLEWPSKKNHLMPSTCTATVRQRENISAFCLECLAVSREEMLPDPQVDPVVALFYCCTFWSTDMEENYAQHSICGVIAVASDTSAVLCGCKVDEIFCEENEIAAIRRLVERVRFYDPDILTGYEVHAQSWGYVIDRTLEITGRSLAAMLGRIVVNLEVAKDEVDSWGYRKASGIRVLGRHVINVWRVLRKELHLINYAFENVVFEVLQRSEFARVYGVDFMSIITRGSQFKVESLLLRVTKLNDYLLLSPDKHQAGSDIELRFMLLAG